MRNRQYRSIFSYLIPILILTFLWSALSSNLDSTTKISIDSFVSHIEKNEVESVVSQGNVLKGTLKDKNKTKFEVYMPEEFRVKVYEEYLKEPVEKGNLTYTAKEEPGTPWYVELLPTLLIMVGFLFVYYYLFRKAQGGQPGVGNFGKSRAKLNKTDSVKVTFDDVAGLKEEKQELMETVDFLKNPKKYIDMGARIPKGVLLVGPPGTGKTYLSKAVAGEAGVPFFSISGSDFVEMFVGVGASRVRDLFKEGLKNAPCIIFIDEIDAVGRKRGAGLGGGNDEREQTLNQLLVEMDGFSENTGVIVMAATNRPDILDPALLRPGRFDRQIFIGMPDVEEREEMLEVHTRKKRLADDVDLKDIARATAGYTPADLENVTNEAALLSAREGLKEIPNRIFQEAVIKVIAGPEKKSRVVIERERRLTAYHEAGHAIVTRAIPNMDVVNLITIVPRGRAGGFTSFLPEDDISFHTKTYMKNKLVTMLGGRAAEEVVLHEISTGASNDIQRATKIARSMVTTYGMSDELGPVNYGEEGDDVFLGRDFGRMKNYSEEVAVKIDEEVHDMMTGAYEKAKEILRKNMELLHAVASVLLEKETIHKEEFETLFRTYGVEEEDESKM